MFRISLSFVCLIAVFQFSGCAELQSIDSIAKGATPTNKLMTDVEEKFAKDAKSKYDVVVSELERNRRLWQENRIVNYDFVAWKLAPGVSSDWNASPALIKVRNGEKISLEAASEDKDYKIDSYEGFDTIDKLFDYILKVLKEGRQVNVKYNKKYGYAEDVSIIFAYASDSSNGINITKFEIIK